MADTATIITSIATVFISLIALGFTIWQGRETKKHNKLSVRPLLTLSIDWENGDENNISCKLINSGIGPAVIKDIKCFYKKEELEHKTLKSFFDTLLENINSTYYLLGLESVISEGEEVVLLSLYYDYSTKHYINIGNNFDVFIKYESIYGDDDEVFTLDTIKKRKGRCND